MSDVPFLVECESTLRGVGDLESESALVCPSTDGVARITLSNTCGFTQTIDSGTLIGGATTVAVKTPITPHGHLPEEEGVSLQGALSSQAEDTNAQAMVQLVGCPSVTTEEENRRFTASLVMLMPQRSTNKP